jgi:Holliday junction DNA helicase RuvA
MIANIEGHLGAIEKNAVIIQVGGIGMRVYVPGTFIANCGPIGSTVSVHTHLHVREDELALYGCATEDELRLFELLLSVSGVGPRVGLALLSALSPDDVRIAIAGEQAEVLARVPGIGSKTAKKIIFDLKDKVRVPEDVVLVRPQITEEDSEAIAALTALGYSVVEAQTALQHVPVSVHGVEERLRAALVYLGS